LGKWGGRRREKREKKREINILILGSTIGKLSLPKKTGPSRSSIRNRGTIMTRTTKRKGKKEGLKQERGEANETFPRLKGQVAVGQSSIRLSSGPEKDNVFRDRRGGYRVKKGEKEKRADGRK